VIKAPAQIPFQWHTLAIRFFQPIEKLVSQIRRKLSVGGVPDEIPHFVGVVF
jgi:hypothetical protein